MKKEFDFNIILKKALQIAPVLIIVICAGIYLIFFRGMSAEKLLEYTPENMWLAAMMIIGLFALKSLSVIFPMSVLVITSGLIAPNLAVALIINTVGTFVMMNIPYFIGRCAERELVEGMLKKNRKIDKVREINMQNQTAFVYFLRIINLLPYDIVSMFLGSSGCKWGNYVIGSLLGTLPGMICCTISGAYASKPLSIEFIASVVVNVLFSVVSGVIYLVYIHKKKTSG